MIEQGTLNDLERIVNEYQDSLFRFAFFRTGSLADSQDIVQNVFLKMYENKIDFSKIDKIKSYLYRSISNSCSNYFREKHMVNIIPIDAVIIQDEDSDTADLTREYERIRNLMSSIPEDQSEIIKMRTIDGLAFTEISEILDIPVTTVKSRFKYGIDKLKSKIKKQEDLL